MNNIMISFFISALAGIATLIGFLSIFVSRKKQDGLIAFSLAFSAGIMLIISIVSLLPEAYNYQKGPIFLRIIYILISINIGILVFTVISKKLEVYEDDLYKLGIISTIALILHNIPEGITTYLSTFSNNSLGIELSLAIAFHNIAEGMSISIPIYFSTKNKYKAFIITLVAGLSELLGTIIAFLFLQKYLSFEVLSSILGITAGIMIYLSIKELIPKSLKYNNLKLSLIGLLFGIVIMIICNILL